MKECMRRRHNGNIESGDMKRNGEESGQEDSIIGEETTRGCQSKKKNEKKRQRKRRRETNWCNAKQIILRRDEVNRKGG